MRKMKYAALNMGVLFLAVALLGVLGALIEGELAWQVCLGAAALLMFSIRAAWREICHMERAVRHARRAGAARRAAAYASVPAACKAPDLRVA